MPDSVVLKDNMKGWVELLTGNRFSKSTVGLAIKQLSRPLKQKTFGGILQQMSYSSLAAKGIKKSWLTIGCYPSS